MPVSPVGCATRPEALLALVHSLGTPLCPNGNTASCAHLFVDKLAKLLHGDPYGPDKSMRYQLDKLLSNKMTLNVFIA